jgi:hypothetical protein
MNQLPFTVYDFFGYLASGAVVLAGCTAAFVGYEPFESSPGLLVGFILVIAIYVIGHIVANLAGDLIERRLVRSRLHPPTEILLGFQTPGKMEAKLLPGYSTPLPTGVKDQIIKLAQPRTGDALFFHCHAVMKSDSAVQVRLETFLNLYGFCRNMTLALLIVAFSLVAGLILGTAETGPAVGPGWWVLGSVVGAIGMFYRYLKFYRQFAVELLTSYAERKQGNDAG